MEVYCAVFDGNSGEMITETEAKILDEQSFTELEGKKVLFVGDGAAKAKDILQISNAEFDANIYPSAKYLIKKSVEKFNQKDFEDVAYFEPFYLKDFHGVKKNLLKIHKNKAKLKFSISLFNYLSFLGSTGLRGCGSSSCCISCKLFILLSFCIGFAGILFCG
jgi:hypothetical protein